MADYNINGTLVCSSPFYSNGLQSIAQETTTVRRTRLFVLPELNYGALNTLFSTSLSASSTLAEYLTVWLRYITTYYSDEITTGTNLWPLFIGAGQISGALTIIFQSYGSSNEISNNMPKYGYGLIMKYNEPLIRFKVASHVLTLYQITETTL